MWLPFPWRDVKSRSTAGEGRGFSLGKMAQGRAGWIYSLRLVHGHTAPNCKTVWCGVCVMLLGVWSVCVVPYQPLSSVSFLSAPGFPLTPCFFSPLSSLCSCIMWSGWTCIVIRPYGGGGVSESAWRWLNNSKQSFLSMGTPLGQTRFKVRFCSGLSAWQGADIKSWHDTQILILTIDFQKPFLCILFFIFTSLVVLPFLFYFH